MSFVKGRCLDIGCGAGRIMKFLQNEGVDICGIDVDRDCIRLCTQLGIKNVHIESWEYMDKFGSFDTILLLNRSIGMGGNVSGVKSILSKCHECTSREGILIFDSHEIDSDFVKDGSGIFENKIRFKYNNKYSEAFPWIHFSSLVANKLLAKTGWQSITKTKIDDKYCMVCKKGK